MDSRVSARVPVEKRKQADEALNVIGATTTQLIQSAFDYLIETGDLPRAQHQSELDGGHLSDAQKHYAQKVLKASTCKVDPDYFEGKSYDDLLEEELRNEYEALA